MEQYNYCNWCGNILSNGNIIKNKRGVFCSENCNEENKKFQTRNSLKIIWKMLALTVALLSIILFRDIKYPFHFIMFIPAFLGFYWFFTIAVK